jgi:mono/diheme cytochrome c family protein
MLQLIDRGLTAVSVVAVVLVVVLLFAGPSLIGAKKSSATGAAYGTGAPSGSGTQSGSTAPSGSAVFASAGCGGCHTLKAAGASGAIGPNLDQLRPSTATVTAIVRSGGGSMPSFAGKLSDDQIAAVATFVSTVAGR